MRALRFWFEAAAFRLLLALSRWLPRRVLLAFGSWLGSIGFRLDARHRAVTLENLAAAYGGSVEDREIRDLARNTWRILGRNLIDALSFSRFGPESVGNAVHYEGLSHIRDAYARGKGVLLFSAHFGHWELTAMMQGYLNLPLTLITRPLDNPALERMLADLRGSSGNRIVHKRNAVREILKALREGSGVAIVIDQDARDGGLFVPFFGRLASTTPTLARMALRTGAAIVPTFCVPQSDGTYRITYEPEIEVRPGDDIEAEAYRLTEVCTAVIEKWVRAYPEHWFWVHRRWKTRPPLDFTPPSAD